MDVERSRRLGLVRGVRPRRAVATCLVVALLTPACATSRSGSTLPEVVTAPSQEECEALAQKAKAAVQGSSGGFALGAPPRTDPRTYNYSQNTATGTDAAILVGIYAGILAVVALVAGVAAAVKDGQTREAAYDDAMAVCLRPGVLARELGPEHPEVARSLHTLAYLYVRQAEPEKAEPLFARALWIREQLPDVDPAAMATLLDDYAALRRQAGREGEAVELERRALEIRRAKR